MQVDEIASPIEGMRDRIASIHHKVNQLPLPQQTLLKEIYEELYPLVEELKVAQEGLCPSKHPTSCPTVEEALKQAKKELELRVEERTTELRATNDQLLNEVVERKRAEVELERSLSLLEATLESTTDGILVVGLDGKVKIFNQKFLQMWGSPEAIAHLGCQEALTVIQKQVKDPIGFLTRSQQLQSQPEVATYDILEFKDGRIFERYSQPQRVRGQIVGRVMSYRDITARKRAEEELEKSLSLLRGTLEATVDGILVSQNAENIVAFNQKFVEIWGIPEAVITSREISQVLPFILKQLKHPEAFLEQAKDLFAQLDAKRYGLFELKDGRVIERYSQPQRLGKIIIGRVCSFRDITERNRTQSALLKSEATNQALLNAIPDLMIRMSRSGTYLDFIPAKTFKKVRPIREMRGKNIYNVMPREIAQQRMHYVEQAISTGETQSYEFKLAWDDGNLSYEEARIVVSGDDEVLVIVRDITERKQMEEALRASEERYRRIIETTSEGVWIIDAENKTVFANNTMAKMLGYSLDEMLGMSLLEFINEEWQSLAIATMSYVQRRDETIRESFDFQLYRKDGSSFWALVSANPIFDQSGQYTGALGMFTDITQRKIAEEKIHYQAMHDLLTGLPNRTLFNEELSLALTQAENCHLLSVMFLDLDRFKTINDTLGHAIGDRLLQDVAQRLTNCLHLKGRVARWGGDEFTVLLPQVNNAEESAQIASEILAAMKPAFNLEGHQLHISISIGIAHYPCNGEDAETLLRNADAALYRTKQQGRNNYQFYAARMNSQASELLLLENELHHALSRSEFVVYYQPQVNTTTGKITGMEALVRWQHPNFGLISPAKFIPLAEETGLIIPIDKWVLQTACAQNKAWQDAGLPPIRMSVNLSARQFQQPSLLNIVAQTLQQTGLSPQYLELEITETLAMQDVELSKKILNNLHQMGVHISLDDFGTGYSSLGYLKQFPLNTLKIDKSFVRDLETDPLNAGIIKAIMTLGKGFNLRVIAEGVETEAEKDCLQSFQCEEIQGYLSSRPLPAQEATEFIRNYPAQLSKTSLVA